MGIFLLIVGLVLFVGLVVVHEFGHFIVARRNGIEVEEFGIGFPPRAWSKRVGGKRKDGFLFSLNWLPIGGFVKLKGEHDNDTEPGSFGAASFKAKTKVMLAGVGMNLLAAFVLFMILAWVGMPQLLDHQFTVKSDTKIAKNEVLVGSVEKGSPAAVAKLYNGDVTQQRVSLQPRDRLLRITTFATFGDEEGINTFKVTNAQRVQEITKKLAGYPVLIEITRQGHNLKLYTELNSSETVDASKKAGKPKGYLGMSPAEYSLTRSTWSAPLVALGLIKQFTVATFQGLGTAISALFHGNTTKASEQVSGPVGIFVILKDGSLLGYQFVLLIIGVISLTLAIMNVLPIPALDGGRLFLLLVARAIKKPLSEVWEERIVGAGFAFLMGLIILITIVDVRHFL